jgi:hypothetical protein
VHDPPLVERGVRDGEIGERWLVEDRQHRIDGLVHFGREGIAIVKVLGEIVRPRAADADTGTEMGGPVTHSLAEPVEIVCRLCVATFEQPGPKLASQRFDVVLAEPAEVFTAPLVNVLT